MRPPIVRRLALAVALAGTAPAAAAQSTPAAARPNAALARTPERRDPRLEAQLAALTRGFEGEVGIYVRHLRTGRTAVIRADELFPTASMIKVPILVGMFDAVAAGRLRYQQPLTYRTRSPTRARTSSRSSATRRRCRSARSPPSWRR
jgi:beta-lactamase class A